jgi:nitrite reductase (NADH) large subunit
MAEAEYLIVGNGMAGITAVQEIRHADPAGRILLVGDEGEPYYYRASLSEWISGDITDEMLPGRTREFYEQMHIEQVMGHVLQVDAETRRAYLADGDHIDYAKTLIATGAHANTIPIPGLPETLVFRSLADAREIKARLGCCGRALILGGGVLGLELAGAIHEMGIPHIAVVHRSGFVGRPLLDEPAAEWVQARMRADGIDLFLDDTVERVEGRMAHLRNSQAAAAAAAEAAAAVAWEFDVFVQTVGITPVFPEVPGLTVGQGIRIDARCRTNLPGIYAAGDCTETRVPGEDRWQTTRVWLDCARQGRVAGRNMAADEAALHRTPFFNASIIYRTLYAFAGEPHGEEGKAHIWRNRDGYRKLRVVDGRLAGALLLGQRQGSYAILKAIGQPVARFGADIACPDFPYNDLSGQDWDYLFY